MSFQKSQLATAIKAVLMTAPGITVCYAQEAQEAQKAGDIQEVTVYGQAVTYRPEDQTTATGLRMKLIDTPQSISVISEEMLEVAGGRSAYDAVDMIPGAHQGGQGFMVEQIAIRGQYGQPRINSLNFLTYAYVDAYMVERLEVVRGPATVLYGVTGAFGGELNQILKSPQGDFHVNLGFEGGDFDNRRYEADFTGPIPGTEDRLKVRAVGAYADYGIPQKTVPEEPNIDKAFTVSMTYDFSPNTSGRIYLYDQERNIDPTDGCTLAEDANNRLYLPKSVPLERWYCGDAKQANSSLTNDFAIAALSHKFANDWQIEAKVGRAETHRVLDYVFAFGPAGAFGLADSDIYLYSYLLDEEDVSVTSNLSLSGEFDLFNRTHQFFAALEYQKQDQILTNFTTTGVGFLNMFEDGGMGVLSDGSPIPFGPDPVKVGDRISINKELRSSVQILFNPFERLQILGGLLVQRTELETENRRVLVPLITGEINQTDTIPRFGVSYDLTDKRDWLTDARAYFSYSEGVRPNVGIFDAAGMPLTDPQEMESYEVGLKTEWLDGNVAASLAWYSAELTNDPTQIFGMVGGAGGTFSATLDGKREYNGIELEVLGEVLPGWNAALAYTYTDTKKFSELISERLAIANVPKQQASLYTSYEFLTGNLKGLTVGTSVVRKIDSPLVDNVNIIFSMGYDPNDQVLDSNTRLDFRLSYKGFSDPLTGLEVFASLYNALDERTYYSISGTPAFTNTIGRPRTITAGIKYSFGL